MTELNSQTKITKSIECDTNNFKFTKINNFKKGDFTARYLHAEN